MLPTMSEKQRKIGGGDRGGAQGQASAKDALRDVGSAELAKLAKVLGNDEVQQVIAESSGKRDALLDLVMQRLQAVHQLQMLEVHEIKNRKNWWRKVGHQTPGFSLPDAGRWRAPANAWRQVAQALAQGQLGRAASLMDRAVEAERVARAAMPKQIQVPTSLRVAVKPEEAQQIGPGEGCPPTSASAAFALADQILAQADRAEEVPVPRHLKPHRWWEATEEDDEKKDGKPGKKADAKQPAAAGEVKAPELTPPAERVAQEQEEELARAKEQEAARGRTPLPEATTPSALSARRGKKPASGPKSE